jgi:D-alanyl-D-alanine carboxypeptidase (penicillin-binding protein 5/6)
MSDPSREGSGATPTERGPGAARGDPGTGQPPRAYLRASRAACILAGLAAGVAAGLSLGAVELGDATRLGVAGSGADLGGEQAAPAPSRKRHRDLHRDPRVAVVTPGDGEPLSVTLDDAPAAGIVFDVRTGRTLWRQDIRETLPVASLTKIMTALVVVDELTSPGRRIAIGPEAAGTAGAGDVTGSAIGLEEGMRVKVAALFQSMLIASHNDAATALAVQAAGSERRFVARMNRRAESLDLGCTRFVSAHGFEPGNRSCALDVGAMTRLAIRERRIREVARRERAVVDFPADGGERYLYTTNPLLETDYPGTIGLKTGYTEHAGRSLAAVVRRDGRTLAAILLDSPDPERQARLLLDAAFDREPGSDRRPAGAHHRAGGGGPPLRPDADTDRAAAAGAGSATTGDSSRRK